MNFSLTAFLRASACSAWAVGLICATPAMAQRFVSNSNSGNDPTLDVSVTRLVGCELGNTNARIAGIGSGGNADACTRIAQSAETLAQVQSITLAYNNANLSHPYSLQLVNTAADRLTLGNTISSGGLFGIVAGGGLLGTGGLGNDHVEMQFRRGAVGSFVMAFSGTYDDGVPGNAQDLWSAYYLFDDVAISPPVSGSPGSGLMNYKLYQSRSRVNPLTGETDLFRDYTSSLVVNQVSIYELNRVSAIPEPGTWVLMGAGLAALVGARRRRRSMLGER